MKDVSGRDKTMSVVWDGKRPPSRGPKPTLSKAQIAHAAVRLADNAGLEAVTMQGLAREMRVSPMALYRYFASKADLVSWMIDSAGGPPPDFGGPSLPWQHRLKDWARRCLAIYREHPWFLEATSARSSLPGPNELSWMEAALEMLPESGLGPRELHDGFLTIISHVRGYATLQRGTGHHGVRGEWVDGLARLAQLHGARYQQMTDILRSHASTDDIDRAFEFGLRCILEGMSTRKRERAK